MFYGMRKIREKKRLKSLAAESLRRLKMQTNKQTSKQTREFINMLVGHVLWHEENKKKEVKSLAAESRALRFSSVLRTLSYNH